VAGAYVVWLVAGPAPKAPSERARGAGAPAHSATMCVEAPSGSSKLWPAHPTSTPPADCSGEVQAQSDVSVGAQDGLRGSRVGGAPRFFTIGNGYSGCCSR
jgi:hypothetical protein